MEIKAIRGFNDVLPDEAGKWQFVEKTAREIFEGFGFSDYIEMARARIGRELVQKAKTLGAEKM